MTDLGKTDLRVRGQSDAHDNRDTPHVILFDVPSDAYLVAKLQVVFENDRFGDY